MPLRPEPNPPSTGAPSAPVTPPSSTGETAALDRAYHLLLETARQLGSSLDPTAIFTRLKDSVCGAMQCDGLIVSSFDRNEGLIRCAYAWVGGNVLDPSTLPPLTFRPDSGGMQTQVLKTGKPMIFSDVAERVRDPKGKYYEVDPSGEVRDLRGGEPPKARSAVMVPLLLEGAIVGVVQVMADAEDVYGPPDLEFLEGVSLLLAVALENAHLYRRAQDEIEERRRAERELRRTEEALRDADRRKDEFLATLAHELRNPLAPIRTAAEMLDLEATPDPNVRWSREVIQRQVAHLTRLIDDLLDVGRITQGKLELRRDAVEINDVLGSAVETVRPLASTIGQRLVVRRTDDPVFLHGDPVRLAQVFSNLLDNAIKYTTPAGWIDVSVERHGDEAVVFIRDDGAGITPEHLPQLFDLFYQADRSIARMHGGLGIGLTLVKRLVEMHGGTIEASSEGSGRGSTFVVRLPALAEPATATTPVAPTAASSPRALRILIADDNRDSTDSMAMLLSIVGHEVRVAYDGEEALRVAEEQRPDVLLLDLGMPRLNGHEVAQRVRAAPWGREPLLIAATGWGQDEDRRRTLEAGFDAHLVKPLEHVALIRLIGELLVARESGSTSAGQAFSPQR